MKHQTILLLTGIAAGLMTVSCETTADEDAEAFFGHPAPNRARFEAEEKARDEANRDYYAKVNAHIDRRLNDFNEKEEVQLPVFSSDEAEKDFMELSFINNADQISLLSMDFTSHSDDSTLTFVFDRDSRTFTRTVGGAAETFTFSPFTNGVKPNIPYDAHILYGLVMDFNRIAKIVTLRCYDKLEKGENPSIAELANAANIDENGKKIDKDFVELKPKVVSEPMEYYIDKRWCHRYDVELKSFCAPAVSMTIYVSIYEKTVSRVDLTFDDGSVRSFITDWNEQDGLVLPRVIRRIGDDPESFTRGDTTVILKRDRANREALAALEAANAESEKADGPGADSEGDEAIGSAEESSDDEDGSDEESFEDFEDFEEE